MQASRLAADTAMRYATQEYPVNAIPTTYSGTSSHLPQPQRQAGVPACTTVLYSCATVRITSEAWQTCMNQPWAPGDIGKGEQGQNRTFHT